MKTVLAFLILLFLAAPAAADRVYVVKGTSIVERDSRSCGAAQRMMRDKHTVKIEDSGRILVNMVPWKFVDDDSMLPGWAHIKYQVGDNYTFVAMKLYANDRKIIGLYMLRGMTSARKPCVDMVRVEGERL